MSESKGGGDHFTIGMGFDYTKVTAGLAKIDALIAKTNTEYQKLIPNTVPKNPLRPLVEANRLRAKRLALEKSINKAAGLGLNTSEAKRNPAIKDLAYIEGKRLALEERITRERQKQVELGKKQTKASPFLSEKRAFSLSEKALQTAEPTSRKFGRDSKEYREAALAAEMLAKKVQKLKSIKSLAEWNAELRTRRSINSEVIKQANNTNRLAKVQRGLKDSTMNLARAYISVYSIIAAGRSLLRVGTGFEDMSATMLLASGDARQAGKDFEFVKMMANEVGLNVLDTAKSFAKFAVAGKTAGVTIETVKKNFEALSVSVRSSGANAESAKLAFLGFQQMMAGPVVQAQEMNQIIEQMPQFSGMAAAALKEMGFQGENYRETIATGTVDSKKFIDVVSRLMKEQAISTGAYAKAQHSLTAEIQRWQNAMDMSQKSMFTSGRMGETLQIVMRGLSALMEGLTPLITAVSFSINVLVESLSMVLTPINKLVKALGVDSGLGGVLAFLAGPLALAGVVSTMGSFLGLLQKVLPWILKVTGAMRIMAAVQAFMVGLTGPQGIALVAGAAVAGIAAAQFVGDTGAFTGGGSSATTNVTVGDINVNTGGETVAEDVGETLQDIITNSRAGNPR